MLEFGDMTFKTMGFRWEGQAFWMDFGRYIYT